MPDIEGVDLGPYLLTTWGLYVTYHDPEDTETFAFNHEVLELDDRPSWMLRGLASNPDGLVFDDMVGTMQEAYPDIDRYETNDVFRSLRRVFGWHDIAHHLRWDHVPRTGSRITQQRFWLEGLLSFDENE